LNENSHSHRLAYIALAAVCFFWGTTYLGIRIALETLPPALLLGSRYLLSGTALLVGAKLARIPLPRGRELWLTAACGVIGIGAGNGFLALAELRIPSGTAALFYTTAPFWMIGIDAFLPHGKKPLFVTLIGLCVGMFGVAYMIYPAAIHEGMHGNTWPGFLLIQLSAASWTFGAMLQKRVHSHAPPFVSGGVQQLAVGVTFMTAATVIDKIPHAVGTRATLAVLYLVVFGSILGYSSFIYVVKNLPVAIATTYYFVNPVVAVLLGWIVFREPFGVRSAVAMLIIFAGIGVVRWSERTKQDTRLLVDTEEAGVVAE
jgi:drug/metabolite transporter (DMT)-like permease